MLKISRQSIYSAITLLRRKSIKIELKNGKYYIDKIIYQFKCDNIFCLHNIANNKSFSKWNETDCGMYEIDPFCEENPEGFKIQDCPSLKKYKKFGW